MSSGILQLGNILGCILQPIYLCLFIIFTKKLSKKRMIFIILTIMQYFIIQNIAKFDLNINADLLFIILFYLNIKVLYGKKGRITDLITYIISFLLMGIVNMICILLFGIKIITIIIANIVLILFIIFIKEKLNNIEKFYNKFWNKHDFKFIKSVTIRGFSATLTIITFVILHFWITYGVFIGRR